jgi:transcription antitermination factor NusG
MSKPENNSCVCIYFESFRKRPDGLSENSMQNTIQKIYALTQESQIEIKESYIKTSPDKNLSFIYLVCDKSYNDSLSRLIKSQQGKIGFKRVFSVNQAILKQQQQREKQAQIRKKQTLPGDKVMILDGEFADMFAQVDSINEEDNTLVVKITTFSNVFCYETLEMDKVRKLSSEELKKQ